MNSNNTNSTTPNHRSLDDLLAKLINHNKPIYGNNRSKALNSTPRLWMQNYRTVYLYQSTVEKPRKLRLSTRSVKTLIKFLSNKPNLGTIGSKYVNPLIKIKDSTTATAVSSATATKTPIVSRKAIEKKDLKSLKSTSTTTKTVFKIEKK